MAARKTEAVNVLDCIPISHLTIRDQKHFIF